MKNAILEVKCLIFRRDFQLMLRKSCQRLVCSIAGTHVNAERLRHGLLSVENGPNRDPQIDRHAHYQAGEGAVWVCKRHKHAQWDHSEQRSAQYSENAQRYLEDSAAGVLAQKRQRNCWNAEYCRFKKSMHVFLVWFRMRNGHRQRFYPMILTRSWRSSDLARLASGTNWADRWNRAWKQPRGSWDPTRQCSERHCKHRLWIDQRGRSSSAECPSRKRAESFWGLRGNRAWELWFFKIL